MIKYLPDFPTFSTDDSFTVIMGLNPLSKAEFLKYVGQKLQFPRYYGENWDALQDCLGDLSWLNKTKITLIFPVPPLASETDLSLFLEIVDAAQKNLAGCGVELEVVFLRNSSW